MIDKEKSLAYRFPELAKEWHPTKNGDLTPNDVTCGSGKRVWWKCIKGHEWEVSISNRTKGNGCPYCSGKKIWPGFNDLATKYPGLLAEWDYELNDVDPTTVAPANGKKYHWICPQGHKYEASVSSRTRLHTGCPYCVNQKVLPGYNDLATKNPELLLEWDYVKNSDFTPKDVSPGSEKYAWWICSKCGKSWKSMVYSRAVDGTGCPNCSQEYQTSFPEQAIFYYLKNVFNDCISRYQAEWLGNSELDIYIPSICTAVEYDGRAWHKSLLKDIEKNQLCADHNIKLIRLREPGLKRIEPCIMLRSVKHKDLSQGIIELCALLNISIDIDVIRDRLSIYEIMGIGEKTISLASEFPSISAEWDYVQNYPLTPEKVTPKSGKTVWWICPQGHNYTARIDHRTGMGTGCTVCTGKRILVGINDFASQEPKLAREWNYRKNSKGPEQYTVGYGKNIWWVCSRGHEWEATIHNRVKHKSGCPFCAGQKAIPGETDVGTTSPHLLEEWDYEKNKGIEPSQYLPQSHKEVWWICKNCGHKWLSTIKNRTKGSGCPNCSRKRKTKP